MTISQSARAKSIVCYILYVYIKVKITMIEKKISKPTFSEVSPVFVGNRWFVGCVGGLYSEWRSDAVKWKNGGVNT